MAEVVHLTAEAVKIIHAKVLRKHGGLDGLRDEGLLHSAVSAPQATWGGNFATARCRANPCRDALSRQIRMRLIEPEELET